MTNYVWTIISLEAAGTSQVVNTANWALEIKEGNTSLASLQSTSKFDNTVSNNGIVPVSVPVYPNPDTFIEFSALKESDVIKWVENGLGESLIRTIKNQLQFQVKKQNQIKSLNLPRA